MSRVHDVGGQTGFGPVDPGDPAEPAAFAADWEARVFAVQRILMRRGLFTGDEMRDAIESLPPEQYLAAPYFERWLEAIEVLLDRKGVA
jgi:nitrile hydratase subunit beta